MDLSQFLSENLILEKLIQHGINKGGNPNYGNVVLLSGGAAAGKGFVISNFMDSQKFKVRDVDEWKRMFIEMSKTKSQYDELKSLNLKNPSDVFKLHQFITDKGIKYKTLDLLFSDLKEDRMPNIIFDITGKKRSDITELVETVLSVGYKPINVNMVFVVQDVDVAIKQNKERSRTVPDHVLIATHTGAASTFITSLEHPIEGIDGRIDVVLNLRSLTKVVGKLKDGKSGVGGYVEDFSYINLKKPGQKIDKNKAEKSNLESIINQLVFNYKTEL